jgi:hypothetical protein
MYMIMHLYVYVCIHVDRPTAHHMQVQTIVHIYVNVHLYVYVCIHIDRPTSHHAQASAQAHTWHMARIEYILV